MCMMDMPMVAKWLCEGVAYVVDITTKRKGQGGVVEYARGVKGPGNPYTYEGHTLGQLVKRLLLLCVGIGLMGIPPIRVSIICKMLVSFTLGGQPCPECGERWCVGTRLTLSKHGSAHTAWLCACHTKVGMSMALWIDDPYFMALLWLWGGDSDAHTRRSLRDVCYYITAVTPENGPSHLIMSMTSLTKHPNPMALNAYSTYYTSTTRAACNPAASRRSFFTATGHDPHGQT
jgi:hypothetical protein